MACLRIWYPPAVQISMPDSGDIDRFGKILVCTVFQQSHLSSTSPVAATMASIPSRVLADLAHQTQLGPFHLTEAMVQ